jgi:integrase
MLKDVEVRGAKKRTDEDGQAKSYKLFDQGGLHLFVSETGTKIWRYQFRLNGKQGLYTIGRYANDAGRVLISLTEAREKHRDAQKLVAEGINPSTAKQDAKKAALQAKADSFSQVSQLWLDWFRTGKSERHVATTEARLRNYILPALGAKPVNEVTAQMLMAFTKSTEAQAGRETADRCLMIVGQILRWAVANGITTQNVHAGLKPGEILQPVDKTKPTNFARLDEKDLPGLLKAIEVYQGSPLARFAMKLMSYTLLRTGELINMRWSDVDTDAETITIPADRMKAGRDHVVPLSRQASEILRELRKLHTHLDHKGTRSEYVFPGTQGAATMSSMTLLMMLKRMGYGKKMTGHGWRGVASTILNEHGYNRDWIEMALAHVPQGVRADYNKALYLPQRREMLQWYADHLDKLCNCN